MPLINRNLLCVLMLISCTPCFAEPKVLFDAGSTIDVGIIEKTLLDPIGTAVPLKPKTHKPKSQITARSPAKQSEKPLTMTFPLEVPGLTVARVAKRSAEFPQLSSPVCVIGADDQSLSWLVTYYEQLINLNARCLLVQVNDQDQLARVAKYAKDIPVMPDVGGISVQLFNLKHYPVLVSNEWIEQ